MKLSRRIYVDLVEHDSKQVKLLADIILECLFPDAADSDFRDNLLAIFKPTLKCECESYQ